MILAMNVGNSNLSIGVEKNDKIIAVRYPVTLFESKRDFKQAISQFSSKKVCSVIISSVKPELTDILVQAMRETYGIEPLIINSEIKTTFNLSRYDTKLIGSDRIAVCEAAVNKYSSPAVIYDFGTAITINVIDKEKNFLGGSILPGLSMGLNSLSKNTSMLPKLGLISKAVLIGKNTEECLISGAVFGNSSMFDGMTKRIETFLGYSFPVIATGGNARDIIPHCETKIIHEPELLLEGLFYLYKNNCL